VGGELVVPRVKIALVADANVLIDYANADVSVLSLVSRVVGPLHVPDAVLDKVAALDRNECDQLGLKIAEPTLEQLLEAGDRRGKLAHDDRLCLILARDNGWRCITNDKALRAECVEARVEVLWGLEPMLTLVAESELTTHEAETVAWGIHETNPAFVTKEIVTRFKSKLRRIATARRPPRR
jgi:rRNA-processing protein FCF1